MTALSGQSGHNGQLARLHAEEEKGKRLENAFYQMVPVAMSHCFVQEKVKWKKNAMKTSVLNWDHGRIGPNAQLLVGVAKEVEIVNVD